MRKKAKIMEERKCRQFGFAEEREGERERRKTKQERTKTREFETLKALKNPQTALQNKHFCLCYVFCLNYFKFS